MNKVARNCPTTPSAREWSCTEKCFGYSAGCRLACCWASTAKSAAPCSLVTPDFKRPNINQKRGNPLEFVSARTGVSGIHISASPQAKRGGMMPTSVRETPFNVKVLLRIDGSALKRLIQVLWRRIKIGGAPGW